MPAEDRVSAPLSSGGEPNPEAIAWYVEQAKDLLDELRARIESLRSRGSQLAGFTAAVIALAGGNASRILNSLEGVPRDVAGVALLMGILLLVGSLATSVLGTPFRPWSVSDISAHEVANYLTDAFTHEPDLWRIHMRTTRALLVSIAAATRTEDRAVAALRRAGIFFLVGLVTVGVALGILIVEVTF